jgi:uncharacterized integral membrane protein
MIKILKSVHTLLAITFLFVNLYLLILNWGLFTVSLTIDYGFGTFQAPPILMIMVFGTVVVGLIWFTEYTKDLRTEVTILKKDEEIRKLKGNEPLPNEAMDKLIAIESMLKELQKSSKETPQETEA